MNDYYRGRNFSLIETNQNYYKTERLMPNNIFRNFLIKENVDNRTKFFHFKREEILPNYSNIRRKINFQIKEIKSYFDINGTIFKEIKSKNTFLYSKFAKNFELYLFGPNGLVTQKNPHLRKYYNSQEKKKNKIGLNTKIYAGRWEYFEDTSNYNRYRNRLKSNRKKLLDIGGHFSTEDDIGHKIHSLYLKKKKIDEKAKIREEKKKENWVKKPENNKRKFSMINDFNKINFTNIFEFTSVPQNEKRKSEEKENQMNIYYEKLRNRLSISNVEKDNKKDYNVEDNIINNNKNKVNDIIQNKKKKYYLKKIKNIFKREKLEMKINKANKSHFRKLNSKINETLNSIINPSKNLLKNMDNIKAKNQTIYSCRNNNDKFKDDITIIAEDFKKNNDENMDEFVKTNYKKQIIQKKSNTPVKIHFSYYDKGKINAHNNLKDFIRNIAKIKEDEKKRKYGKNIRDLFKNNCKIIEKMEMNLDILKSKTQI